MFDGTTCGNIKHLGEGGYLIKTDADLIPGHKIIIIINNFNINLDTIRTLQKLCKQ